MRSFDGKLANASQQCVAGACRSPMDATRARLIQFRSWPTKATGQPLPSSSHFPVMQSPDRSVAFGVSIVTFVCSHKQRILVLEPIPIIDDAIVIQRRGGMGPEPAPTTASCRKCRRLVDPGAKSQRSGNRRHSSQRQRPPEAAGHPCRSWDRRPA